MLEALKKFLVPGDGLIVSSVQKCAYFWRLDIFSSLSIAWITGYFTRFCGEFLGLSLTNGKMSEFQLDEGPLDEETKALAVKELRETEENVKNGIQKLRKLIEGNLIFTFFFMRCAKLSNFFANLKR